MMTALASVLRCALESALAHVEPTDFPELAEMTITLSNLTEAKEIHVSMTWDNDERAYRMSVKEDTFPFILGDEDLILEDDLTQHLE